MHEQRGRRSRAFSAPHFPSFILYTGYYYLPHSRHRHHYVATPIEMTTYPGGVNII